MLHYFKDGNFSYIYFKKSKLRTDPTESLKKIGARFVCFFIPTVRVFFQQITVVLLRENSEYTHLINLYNTRKRIWHNFLFIVTETVHNTCKQRCAFYFGIEDAVTVLHKRDAIKH